MILPAINLSHRKRNIHPDGTHDDTEKHASNEAKEQMLVANTTKKINFTLVVLFPLVMILFNVIYFSLTT